MNQLVSDVYHFFYDPNLYGYDDDWFKKYSGSGTAHCVNGKIRINGCNIGTLATFMQVFF